LEVDVASDREVMPTSSELIEIYRKCSSIRQNDKRFMAAISAGQIATPYYSPAGQEIIPSAISTLLTADDYVVTIYRGIHDQIAKGVPLKQLWAEIAGRVTGTCKGKGGPMHITHPASGIMVTTGIVGSGMPIANGIALACQIRRNGRVTVCYFGDGACNIGAFHEALNMASLWKLPVVFVCQNNQYAEHTHFSLGTAAKRISDRGAAYLMPAETVDGNDPFAMWRAAKSAIDRARAGEGPTLLEAVTFRFYGHVLGDDQKYMQPGELERAMHDDPLTRFRKMLLEDGHAATADLEKLEAQIKEEIDAAVEFAMSSEYPPMEEITKDVYGVSA
jgi:acetoin:2,6-dichlorophenolindophenol oxidoreductase subunit alpha